MIETTKDRLTLRADVLTGEGETTTSVYLDTPSRSSAPDYMPRHLPFFIPRGEVYYWTREWQRDEQEALKEVERGESKVFHDPKEAVRWLRSPED
jgi:hypothetical protein